MNEDNSPIFIVGCGHSGTTIILAILGRHSELHAVPYESKFGYCDTEKAKGLMKRFDAEAARQGKARWIEKTPANIYKISYILDLIPSAKFLLIVRDGRDVACSLRDRTGNLESGIRRWVKDNQHGKQFWQHPSVHQFKYEDLVEDPEAILQRIFQFIGVPYESGLTEVGESIHYYNRVPPQKEPSAIGRGAHVPHRNWQINQPFFDGRGRWKDLTPEDLSLVNEIGKELLVEFGYLEPEAQES